MNTSTLDFDLEKATPKQVADHLLAVEAELKTIVAKGDNAPPEELEFGDKLADLCQGLRARKDSNSARFKKLGAAAAELDDYLHKPAGTMAHADGTRAGFEPVGSEEAGHTEIEYSGARRPVVVDEVGEGSLGAKTWKAIKTKEYRDAFCTYLRKKGDRDAMPLAERKTLEEGLDDQGGYTVPVQMIIDNIIGRKPTPTRVAAMCSQLTIGREYVEMIKLNYATDNIYSTGFRVTKTGEQPSSATAAQVTDSNLFGTIKIPVHTFYIRGLLTQNMLEDSAIGILGWLGDKFGETVDILKDDKVLNGIGKMEPLGMMQNFAGSSAGAGLDDPKISVINTGDANTVTADGLINLALDVPEQYEDACRFIFNKTNTFKAIRQLKDLNDRYLFGKGMQDSGLENPVRPGDLIGYPFAYSGLMPNVAAGNYPILFGDLSGYQVVNRIGFSVRVLGEIYAETGGVALLGRVRFGGATIRPWGLRLHKVSA